MAEFVTHDELDEAIKGVVKRIDETEDTLRREFTRSLRFEIKRFDAHLSDQDETLKWINRWSLGVLVTLIGCLITVIAIHPHF